MSKTIRALILIISINGLMAGQSTDQTNPTPVSGTEITVKGPKKVNEVHYLSFVGGPGEVSLTINARAKAYSTFIGIKVFDGEMNTLASHNMSADTAAPAMAKKTFQLAEKSSVVISFTSDSNLAECKITLAGAIDASSPPPSGSTDGASQPSPQAAEAAPPVDSLPTADTTALQAGESSHGGTNKALVFGLLDAFGKRFNIPAKGLLRIEMKDGTVQEIDLKTVKNFVIKK